MFRCAVFFVVFFGLFGAALAGEDEPADENPVTFAVGGRIVGRDNKPAPGLAVQVWDALAVQRFLGQGTTGPKGRFLIALRADELKRREHPWGPLLLVVRGPGVADRRLQIAPGTRKATIHVEPSVPRKKRILDHEGQPLPALVVRGRVPASNWWEETTTTEDGSFEFLRMPAGALTLQVVGEGFVLERKWTDGDLLVPELKPVRGIVTGPKGPIEWAEIVTTTSLGPRVVAVTDERGRFDVAAIGGELRAVVRAEGYILAPLPTGGPKTDRRVELTKVPPLQGRVVDHKERPVVGCAVVLRHDRLGAQTAWTDERGRFEFRAVPSGMAALIVRQPGFVPVRARVEADRSADVVLSVERGATVAVQVSRSGRAVAAAHVRVGAREAWTDVDGRALLRGVSPGDVQALATLGATRSMTRTIVGKDGETAALSFDLRDALPLRGTIVSDTGDLLADVEITCVRGEDRRTVRSDPRGQFEFRDVPVGVRELRVAPKDHHAAVVRVWPGATRRLVIRSRLGRAVLRVKTELEPERRGNIAVRIRRQTAPHIDRTAQGPTVVFTTLPAGTYDVTASAEGYLESKQAVVVKDGDVPTELRVKPARGGTLHLVASPGATVIVQRLSGRTPPLRSLKLRDGTQELHGFGPGKYRFLARAPGELIVVRAVEVGPQTPPTSVDLKGGRESTLTVTVQNAVGDPVPDATLRIVGPTNFKMPAGLTGDTGRKTLTRLIRGRVEVFAKAGNREGAEVIEIAPGKALTLTIVVK